MKFLKRSTALIVALILLVSVLSVTAFAALEPEWLPEFRTFKMLSQGSPYTGYVYALQQFLWAYPSSKQYIVNGGGIDGSFGGGTGNAVKAFQTDAKKAWLPNMTVDGIAGGDTWASVAHYLSKSGQQFKYGTNSIMKYANGVLKYYTYNSLGATFHTVSGTVPEY